MKNDTEQLIIRETVDGIPVEEVNAAAIRKKEMAMNKAMANRRKADPYIWGIYLFILCFSIVEIFSASSTEVTGENVYGPLIRHGIFLAGGFLLILGCQNIHYSIFKKMAKALAFISLALLVFASVAGKEVNGAQRAINFAGMTIQPPEIVKLTVVLLLASTLAKYQVLGGVSAKGIFWCAVYVLAFGVFIIQNGLTNMVILMVASVCMFILGGMKIKKILLVFLIYLLGGGVLLVIRHSDRGEKEFDSVSVEQTSATAGQSESSGTLKRQATWIQRVNRHFEGVHPSDPIDDINRQVIFSKFAQAHGGIKGNGPGKSLESARLPLAFSDYIYSIIIEDTGLIGGIILLVLYLSLLARAGIIAHRCSRAFPALLIMGCALLIVCQALIHMAIATGVLPVSGQPLPFISKGGTSVLVMSMAIGMMLSVSRYATTKHNDVKQQQAESDVLPDDIKAANPLQQ